jgi:tetratricopeptide (TPR) repeat protein
MFARPRWIVGAALVPAWLWGQADLYEQGNARLRAGQLVEAEKAYRGHLQRQPRHAEALANLGSVLARREAYSEAIECYERALRVQPQLTPLHLNLGLAYFKTQQWKPAVLQFDTFLQTQGNHRQAMQLRALALLELERYPEAATAFEALLPSPDPTIALGLATAYLRSNRGAAAEKLLLPLMAEGNSPELLLAMGQALLVEERFDEALETLLRARALRPQLPTLGLHIGAVYWRKKDVTKALAEWRGELQTAPESAQALFTLGAALAQSGGDRAEAEQLLRSAVRRKPQHARANFQLAKLIWQKSRNPEAIACLENAISADPKYREAHYLLATVYQALGRKEEAARQFAAVKRLSAAEVATQQDLFSEQ